MPFAYIVLRGDPEERMNGEEHNMGLKADILKVNVPNSVALIYSELTYGSFSMFPIGLRHTKGFLALSLFIPYPKLPAVRFCGEHCRKLGRGARQSFDTM